MEKKLFLNLSSLIILLYFNAFPEYFISISIVYLVIVGVLSSYKIYGLIIQRAFSECFMRATISFTFSIDFILNKSCLIICCIKKFCRLGFRKTIFLSCNKSHLREPINLKNSWQFIIDIGSITKRSKLADLPMDGSFIIGNRLFGLWVPTYIYWSSLIFNLQYSHSAES